MQILTPTSPEEISAILRDASAVHWGVRLDGHGSKRAIGHDVDATLALDMTKLAGVTLYEPEELVLSAKAGTPVAEIAAELARNGQEFAFEPMDYGPLLGEPAGRGTLGGLLAANLSGPRRIARGATRDHMLGLAAVTGAGDIFKAGGRVVKNVTGFDLPRGLAGSWGTLAIFTELTLKVLPRPETSTSLVIGNCDAPTATQAMAAAMGSSADVSGAAWIPAGFDVDPGDPHPRAILRLEGTERSVAARFEQLRSLMSTFGPVERLDETASRRLWAAVRDVRPFWKDGGDIWRLSVVPGNGAITGATCRVAFGDGARFYLDWQGGLVWASLPAGSDSDRVRDIVARLGGGAATRVRGDGSGPAFPPPDAATAALLARMKERFDPHGILEPGRMGS